MKEVAKRLELKSADAAIRWCKKNNIDMIMPLNKWLVPEYAFILAFDEKLMDHLKEKYGIKWVDYFDAYKNNDLKRLYELKNGNQKSQTNGYNPNNLFNRIGYGKP